MDFHRSMYLMDVEDGDYWIEVLVGVRVDLRGIIQSLPFRMRVTSIVVSDGAKCGSSFVSYSGVQNSYAKSTSIEISEADIQP